MKKGLSESARTYGTAGNGLNFQERFGRLIEMVGGAGRAAELLGRGWSTIDNWRKGTSRVPLMDALKLADAAGVTLDWVATGYDRRPNLPPPAGMARGSFKIVHLYQPSTDGQLIEIADTSAEVVAFREEWLQKIGVRPENAALVRAEDDAMTPVIEMGDILLVDRGARSISGGGIYVFLRGGSVIVRRVQVMMDGAVQLIPDNPSYDKERVSAHDATQISAAGRVRAAIRLL